MLRINHKHIISFCVLWATLYSLPTQAENFNTSALSTSLDGIQRTTQIQSTQIRKTFCDNLNDIAPTPTDNTSTLYAPEKSLFVYLMCNDTSSIPFNQRIGFSEKQTFSYLRTTKIKNANGEEEETKILDTMIDPKKREKEIITYTDKIFEAIIKSYINIRQAKIYGVKSINDEDDIENQINTQITTYFPPQPKQTTITLCQDYPKTCQQFKKYFISAGLLIKGENTILETERTNNRSKIDKYCNTKLLGESINKDYDLIVCGLYNDPATFVNLTYNEFMRYTLRTYYYSYALGKFNNLDTEDISPEKQFETQKDRQRILEEDRELNRKALVFSLRNLKDQEFTFPIHTQLLMYAEDINKFGKNLTKTLTPLSTLYVILRNVQGKN